MAACASAEDGGVQSGCNRLIACPQKAMAQLESAAAAARNASAAFSYQKECRYATPCSTPLWAAPRQDVANRTRPSCSAWPPCSSGICAASGTAQASADASAANPRIGRIMGPPATAGDVAQAILRPGSKECNPIGMSACEPVKRLTVKRARAGASEIV